MIIALRWNLSNYIVKFFQKIFFSVILYMTTVQGVLIADPITINASVEFEQFTHATISHTAAEDETVTQSVTISNSDSLESIVFRADDDTTKTMTVEVQNNFDITQGFLDGTGSEDMTVTDTSDYTHSDSTFTNVAPLLIRMVLVELLKLTIANSKNYRDILDGHASNITTIKNAIDNALATIYTDADTAFTAKYDVEIEVGDIDTHFSNEFSANFLKTMVRFIADFNAYRAEQGLSTVFSATTINNTDGASLKDILVFMLDNGFTLKLSLMLTVTGLSLDGVTATSKNIKLVYLLEE